MRNWLHALKHPVNGYTIIVTLLVAISLAAASVEISLTANRNSERKMCKLVESSIQTYEETPPPTDAGRNVQNNWIELKQIFNCPAIREASK